MVGLCPGSSIKHYTRLKTKDNKRYTSPPTKILPMNSIPTPAKTHIICKKRERVSRTLDGPKYHVMERNISTSKGLPYFENKNGKINSSIKKQKTTSTTIPVNKKRTVSMARPPVLGFKNYPLPIKPFKHTILLFVNRVVKSGLKYNKYHETSRFADPRRLWGWG